MLVFTCMQFCTFKYETWHICRTSKKTILFLGKKFLHIKNELLKRRNSREGGDGKSTYPTVFDIADKK